MNYLIESKCDLKDFLDRVVEGTGVEASMSYEEEGSIYTVKIHGDEKEHNYLKYSISVHLSWQVLCKAVKDFAGQKGVSQAKENELFVAMGALFEDSKYYQTINYLVVSDSMNPNEIFNMESFKMFSMRSLYEEYLLAMDVMLGNEDNSMVYDDAAIFIKEHFNYDKEVTKVAIQLSKKGEVSKVMLANEDETKKDELNEQYLYVLTEGMYPLDQINIENTNFGNLEESYLFFSIAMGVFKVNEVILEFPADVPEKTLILWNKLITTIDAEPFRYKRVKQKDTD